LQTDDRQALIVAQVAVKAAVEIAQIKAGIGTPDPTSHIVADTKSIAKTIFLVADELVANVPVVAPQPTAIQPPAVDFTSQPQFITAQGNPSPQQAVVEQIMTQFQGPQGQAVTDMANVPAPQAQISNDSPPDVKWSDALLHNPQNWDDQRSNARSSVNGGKSPDFRHKWLKNGKWAIGLWVKSGDTPAWVHERLGTTA